MNRSSVIVVVLGLAATLAGAATIDILADTGDQTRRDDDSAIWVGQRVAGVGYDGGWRETGHVLVFQLPDLGGEEIESANLLMHAWDSPWGLPLSLDLYGLRYDASNATAASDMYDGPWDTSGAAGTPIMQAFAVKPAGNPAPVNERNVETDAAADLALGAWLTSLYGAGAVAGDFAFLRVSPDTDYEAGSNSYIYFDTADTATIQSGGSTYVQVPTLSITTVPEPASLSLLGLGGLALARRRRVK